MTVVLVATGKKSEQLLQSAKVLPNASPPNANWTDIVRRQGGRDPLKDLGYLKALFELQ